MMKRLQWVLFLLIMAGQGALAQEDTLNPFQKFKQNGADLFQEFQDNRDEMFRRFARYEMQWHELTTGNRVGDYEDIAEESLQADKADKPPQKQPEPPKPDPDKTPPDDGQTNKDRAQEQGQTGKDKDNEEKPEKDQSEADKDKADEPKNQQEETEEKQQDPANEDVPEETDPDRQPLDPQAYIPAGKPMKRFQKITSEYGYRTHPIIGKRVFHTGIDMAAPRGRKIYATAPGKVLKAEASPSYGNYVLLQHNTTYRTAYAHCSKLLVKKGQRVSRGDVIGLVGSTGHTTGTHLHYEVIKDRKKVNPKGYF